MKPPVDCTPAPRTSSAAAAIEVRQISGLTAGAAFPMRGARLRLGLHPNRTGFEVERDANGNVTVTPHAVAVRLDGIPIDGTAAVEDGSIIDAGSARFSIVRTTPADERRTVPVRYERDPGHPVIPVADITRADEAAQRGGLSSPGASPEEDPFVTEIVRRVGAARRVVMSLHRRIHPNPPELVHAARFHDGLRWTRDHDHPLFCVVDVAHMDRPWQPTFDAPEQIDARAESSIIPLRRLIAVPLAADLRAGPLLIAGSRPAQLAVARHIAVAVATMTDPNDLELAVLAPPERASAWKWADPLPHTRPGDEHAVPLLIVDGSHQLDGGLGMALTEPGGVASVILLDGEPPAELEGAMTLRIGDDWSASALDHRTDTALTTVSPVGMTETLASQVARDLCAAAEARLTGQTDQARAIASAFANGYR